MQPIDFEEEVARIIAIDPRFHREAYLFLREALDFTQKLIAKASKNEVRHISGQELLDGIRKFALREFGPMTITLFEEWGIRRCEDFGEIVFTMVEHKLLARSEKDTVTDFKNGYDFAEAFRDPFLPSSAQTKPDTSQVPL